MIVVEDEKLRKSLIASTAQIYSRHGPCSKLEKDKIFETKRFVLTFRFCDNGPYFRVKDKNTDKEYLVTAYQNWWIEGERIYWGAYYA